MSSRSAAAVAALAAALAARSAAAFDGSAVVGGGYSQTDTWAPSSKERVPIWNWMAGGSFHATPLSPGLLQLDGAGQYDSVRNTAENAPSTANGLTFRGSALALGDWVPTSAFASRTVSDFAVDTGTKQTGSTLADVYGADVRYQVPAAPLLELSASRTEQTTRPLTGDEYKQVSNRATVQASQNLPTLDYRLAYDTSWSDGSFADTKYRQHGISFAGGAAVAPEDRVQLTAQYSLRDPRVRDAANPRFDAEFLQGGATLGAQSRWTSFASYTYAHSLVEALASPALEQTSHGASYTATYRYTEALLLTATAGANYAVSRSEVESLRTTGEQAGVGATWSHGRADELQLQLGASGTGGALQSDAGASLPGYGLALSGNVRDSWRLWSGSASYQLELSRNLAAVEGKLLTQHLTATADTRRLAGVAFGARVALSSARRDVALLGASVDRSASASLSAGWRRTRLETTVGTSDGVSDALRSPGFADGLFFGTSFNTHARFASAQLTNALTSRLRLSAIGRWLDSEAPERPRQVELSGSLLVAYDLGQFTFRLEDRLTRGGNGDSWNRTNFVFARVERRFDLNL
jgi:hypothetical protein